MRSLAREESEESPEESDLKKLASVTVPVIGAARTEFSADGGSVDSGP